MEFCWDEAEAQANTYKHGISFGGTTSVFDDPDHSWKEAEQYWRCIHE